MVAIWPDKPYACDMDRLYRLKSDAAIAAN